MQPIMQQDGGQSALNDRSGCPISLCRAAFIRFLLIEIRSRFLTKDYGNHRLSVKKKVQPCFILLHNNPMFVSSKVRDGATLILSKMGISQQPEDSQQDVPGESKYSGASLLPKMFGSQTYTEMVMVILVASTEYMEQDCRIIE